MGRDISCNLGSLNIAKAMDSDDFGQTIETSIRALTAVSDMSNIASVPSIANGNSKSHSVGLGQMNFAWLSCSGTDVLRVGGSSGLHEHLLLHGRVPLPPCVEPHRTGNATKFYEFESPIRLGGSSTKYTDQAWGRSSKVSALFADAGVYIPTQDDWRTLRGLVRGTVCITLTCKRVPPTGRYNYINFSTASVHYIPSGEN